MNATLEEQRLRYIESVETEYLPPENSYWQHPPPSYHYTKDYATQYDKAVSNDGPVIFKKVNKEWKIVAVLLVVASLLIYLVGKNEFGLTPILFLVFLLIVVLPRLLYNKAMIRVSRESIWFYEEDKEIEWKDVLLTYIKEIREETPSYFFIVHYYDDSLNEFHRHEIELNGLVSPAILSSTIEVFRRS